MKQHRGKLIIIGGGAAREEAEEILQVVAEDANRRKGPLLLITAASYEPEGIFEKYSQIFKRLGLQSIDLLDIRLRDEAYDEAKVAQCAKASAIFFTGGDQLRITSQLGDSPIYRCMRDRYIEGVTMML